MSQLFPLASSCHVTWSELSEPAAMSGSSERFVVVSRRCCAPHAPAALRWRNCTSRLGATSNAHTTEAVPSANAATRGVVSFDELVATFSSGAQAPADHLR